MNERKNLKNKENYSYISEIAKKNIECWNCKREISTGEYCYQRNEKVLIRELKNKILCLFCAWKIMSRYSTITFEHEKYEEEASDVILQTHLKRFQYGKKI